MKRTSGISRKITSLRVMQMKSTSQCDADLPRNSQLKKKLDQKSTEQEVGSSSLLAKK